MPTTIRSPPPIPRSWTRCRSPAARLGRRGCASNDYVGTPGNAAAGCALAGAQQAADQQRNALLWAPANLLLLDPLRMTFGPGSSLLDRGLGAFSLLPFVGVVGHGIGLAADVGRGLEAARSVEGATQAGVEALGTAGDTASTVQRSGDTLETGVSSGAEAAPRYPQIALGIDAYLGEFSRFVGAATYGKFGFNVEDFLHAAENADRIHFNLEGLDLPRAIRIGRYGWFPGNRTNFELYTVLENYLGKTTFYRRVGETISEYGDRNGIYEPFTPHFPD